MSNEYKGKVVTRLLSQIIFFLTVFISGTLQAQDSTKGRINRYLSEMNMSFKMPSFYIERDSNFNFTCWDRQIRPPMMFNIMKKDSNVRIAINFQRGPTDDELIRIKSFYNPSFDPDSNYMHHVREYATGQNHKLVFLDKDYVKKHFNADNAVLYERNCIIPVDKIYTHNKEMTIAKNGRGYVEITFIYTDVITEKEIDKEILNTANMLRYNN